jgi:two-component system LytT family response regulator
VDEAVAAMAASRPQIVFLDVQLKGGTGFDVIQQIGIDDMPVVVFVTAYDEHALRAFEANAVDYLLKPFDEERFVRSLARAQRLAVHGGTTDPVLAERQKAVLADLGGLSNYPPRIVVRLDSGYGFVRTADIEWIEAADNYVILHTAGKKLMLRRPMAKVLNQLDPGMFVRIHRSAVVNVEKVRLVKVYSGVEYQVILESGAEILTGRSYRDQVRSRLLQQSPASHDER